MSSLWFLPRTMTIKTVRGDSHDTGFNVVTSARLAREKKTQTNGDAEKQSVDATK